jgi:hypothetical protein
MKTEFVAKMLGGVAIAAVLGLTVGMGVANAGPASGSVAIGSSGEIPGAGETLATMPQTIEPTMQHFGIGTGTFAGYSGTSITDTPGFVITSLTPLSFSTSYSFTSADGTFNNIVASALTQATSTVLNFDLEGTWTGTGLDPTMAFLIAGFTQVGGAGEAISYSATLTTVAPPALVPEPLSLTLLASGLVGLGLFGRRRAN